MERYNVAEGTRVEILAELDQYGRDRHQNGKPEEAAAFARAIAVIEEGGEEARVGHTLYRVVAEEARRTDPRDLLEARAIGSLHRARDEPASPAEFRREFLGRAPGDTQGERRELYAAYLDAYGADAPAAAGAE